MSYDPERYMREEGAIPLRTTNIAPHAGDRLVGFVPYGLTAIRADNMNGKTRLLEALRAIPLRTVLPGAVTMTGTSTSAAIGFGTAELRIELAPSPTTGEPQRKTRRQKAATEEGPIVDLPDPIELMISGGGHVDPEADWRERMRALNDFRPVAATEPRLRRLLLLRDRSEGEGSAPAQPKVSQELLDWLLERNEGQPFPSLLAAAEALAGRKGEINRRALDTEQAAESIGHDVSRKGGAVSQLLEDALKAAGFAAGDQMKLVKCLENSDDPSRGASVRSQEAFLEVARLEASYKARCDELASRVDLRELHGSEPSIDEESEALRIAQDRVTFLHHAWAAKDRELESARGALGEQDGRVVSVAVAHLSALGAWQGSVGRVAHAIPQDPRPNGQEPDFQRLQGLIEASQTALAVLTGALADSGKVIQRRRELEAGIAEKVAALEEASAAFEQASKVQISCLDALASATKRLDTWRRISARLASPVEGATEEQVEKVRERAEEERRNAALESYCVPYARAQRALSEARLSLDRVKARATDLRNEVLEVWNRLGDLMNEALQSEHVRVRGIAIEVQDSDGTWYDVANRIKLSKGRLRQLFLQYYLAESPGCVNVIVPEEILLLVGASGLRAIHDQAVPKKMRLLYEQPQWQAAPELFWYGDTSAPTANV